MALALLNPDGHEAGTSCMYALHGCRPTEPIRASRRALRAGAKLSFQEQCFGANATGANQIVGTYSPSAVSIAHPRSGYATTWFALNAIASPLKNLAPFASALLLHWCPY